MKKPQQKPRAHLRVTIENVDNGFVVECYRADSFTMNTKKGVAKSLDQALDLAKDHFANPPKKDEKAEKGSPGLGAVAGY